MGLFDFMKPKPKAKEPVLSPEEQFRRGVEFYDKDNWGEARKYLLPLAEAGNTEAQWRMFYVYSFDYGNNDELAFQWLKKSAENGNIQGQMILANYYLKKLRPDIPAVIEWYSKAAEQGSGEAMIELGQRYLFGRNGSKRPLIWATKTPANCIRNCKGSVLQ